MKRPLIGLAISAALFLLSIGLCGTAANQHTQTQDTLFSAGLAALALSLVGGGVSFVWLIVALIRGKN